MLRRAAILVVLMAAFAPTAAAQPTELMPGVTYERTVTFTPHGVVVIHVITAPRPGGLYALAPVVARGTLTGGVEPLTQIERDVSATGNRRRDRRRLLPLRRRSPERRRGSTAASSHIRRLRPEARSASTRAEPCTSTASGSSAPGRERASGATLNGLNEPPAPGQTALFTSAYGPRTPAVAGAAEVVLGSFPAAAPNTDLAGAVDRDRVQRRRADPARRSSADGGGRGGGEAAGGGTVGSTIRSRLGLQPTWTA